MIVEFLQKLAEAIVVVGHPLDIIRAHQVLDVVDHLLP